MFKKKVDVDDILRQMHNLNIIISKSLENLIELQRQGDKASNMRDTLVNSIDQQFDSLEYLSNKLWDNV